MNAQIEQSKAEWFAWYDRKSESEKERESVYASVNGNWFFSVYQYNVLCMCVAILSLLFIWFSQFSSVNKYTQKINRTRKNVIFQSDRLKLQFTHSMIQNYKTKIIILYHLLQCFESFLLKMHVFLFSFHFVRSFWFSFRSKNQLQVVLIQGHYLSYLPLCSRNEPVFLATCTPIAMPETRECIVQGATNVFTTIHSMDMKIMHMDKK